MTQITAELAFAAGGKTCRPRIFGIGAEPGHQEHRRPSTRLPTEASGWRSTVRKSIARLVRRPRLRRFSCPRFGLREGRVREGRPERHRDGIGENGVHRGRIALQQAT